MSYLNYNIGKIFSLLWQQLRLNSFISIVLSCIFLGVILYMNRNSKMMKYIFIGINAIILGLIIFLYLKDILNFNYTHPFKNIYVYFLNSIIYLTLILIFNKKIIQNKINLIFYILILIEIIYSIFITIYLKNVIILIIGNIFPEIFFGNIIILASYVYMIVHALLTKKK